MPTIEAGPDRVRIAYDVHGDARDARRPVVLVCGLGQAAHTWSVGLLPALLAAGWRVVTFDHRGMGPSDRPPAPYTVDDHAADTAGLVEALGLGPCHLAGYSLGSWVVETLAVERPDLVRTAAFIGGLNRSTAWERISARYGRDLALLADPPPRDHELMQVLAYLPPARVQDDSVVTGLEALLGDGPPWTNPGRLGQWEAAVAWTHGPDRSERWARIGAPSLVVAFGDDIDSPPARAREAAAHLPDCDVLEIGECTHLGVFERPDAVAAGLDRHWSRHP